MSLRVLIIGQGLFLDGLVRLLAEQPTVQIVGTAANWETARAEIEKQRPDALIVDHADANLRQADLVQGLESHVPTIIYLTLADTKMVVHNWQHVADVQVTDLVQALETGAQHNTNSTQNTTQSTGKGTTRRPRRTRRKTTRRVRNAA
jgi:DNA-binding NarL/FixJ family response regulator